MQAKQPKILIGLIFSIVSFFFFSILDTEAKFAGQMYTPLTVGFYTRVFASLVMVSISIVRKLRGVKHAFRVVNPASQIIRGGMIFCITFAFTNAFILLPLSNTYTIIFTLPIFTAIFGRLFFKEHIPYQAALAIGVGFIGVLLALRPGGGPISIGYFFALAGVIIEAPMFLMIRYFHKDDHPLAIIMYPSIIATFGFFIVHVINGLGALALISPYHILLFLSMGMANVLAQYCIAMSLNRLPASISTSMQYTQIIWGTLFDLFFFKTGHFTVLYVLGTMLVILSSYCVSRVTANKNKNKPELDSIDSAPPSNEDG